MCVPFENRAKMIGCNEEYKSHQFPAFHISEMNPVCLLFKALIT